MGRFTKRLPRAGTLIVAASLFAAACGDGSSPLAPSERGSLTIMLDGDVVAVNETVELSALAMDATGSERPDAEVGWEVSDDAVASIDEGGSLTGLREGHVMLLATWNGLSSSTELEIRGFLISSEGGEAGEVEDEGGAHIEVPAGAMPASTVITVEPASEDALEGLPTENVLPGTAYELGPSGLEFEEDVELSFAYDPATIPSGFSEANLRIARAEASGWTPLPGTPDVAGKRARGKTRHFSTYAVIAIETPHTAPVASIAAPGDGARYSSGTSVSFDGTGVDAEDGPLTGGSLVWTSDLDGQIGTGTSFSTTSLSLGVHTVSLTATDSDGDSGAAQIRVTILNHDPAASITAPADGSSYLWGASVGFDGTGVDAEDGSLSGSSLVWTSDLDGQIGTGASFSTTSLSIGTHTITLTATDSDGGTGTDQVTVTIQNNAPTASITAPADGSSYLWGASVSFAGVADDAEDGALTGGSLAWTSDLDGQIGTGTSFSMSSLSIGVHTITLTATDSNGATATDQITVTIQNNAPVASITAPADGSIHLSGLSITFDGTGTDAEDGSLSGASLVWTSSLDGQIGTGTSFSTSSLSIGAHVITLTVTDSDGATGTATVTIDVI